MTRGPTPPPCTHLGLPVSPPGCPPFPSPEASETNFIKYLLHHLLVFFGQVLTVPFLLPWAWRGVNLALEGASALLTALQPR